MIALLLADSGEHLPRDLELSADLLVDPQEAGRDVADGRAEGASPTPLPEHVPPITTVSSAAPPGEHQRKHGRHDHEEPRTPRRRVTTTIAAHPACTLLTSQRPACSWSENRSRYAAIPPSSTVAVATTNPGVVPTALSETTRGWRPRSAGVT